MTSAKINRRVIGDRIGWIDRLIGDRIGWIDRLIGDINSLPLESYELFIGESRNIWAAESCLRRTLEALLDIGRHIPAKCFGIGITEYKEIARELEQMKVLFSGDAQTLRILAGYRNRLVHFYHEVTTEELYRNYIEKVETLKGMESGQIDPFVIMKKELMIASSDGYFVDTVYNDSKLKKCSEFFEVNYLSCEDTLSIVKKELTIVC